MVVADYSNVVDHERYQLQTVGINNFCPYLNQALDFLSKHKVGPLKQQVHISDFQSSNMCSLPIDDSILKAQPPCNDMFVLTLPFLREEILPPSNHNNTVQWLIITQCNHPHLAPEVILLGLDNVAYSRCKQKVPRRWYQMYHITQENYWQQYVASDAFQLQCLTKWSKSNDDTFSSQFCLLADQLYECYSNFQFYKLKMSLKSPSPPTQLVQAYTQFKQLSRSTMIEIDSVTTYIGVELSVDLDSNVNILNGENNLNQKWTPSVRARAIISIKLASTEATEQDNDNVHLVSVTANFVSNDCSKKNANKKYSIQILNSKLNAKMLSLALDSTTMIDFGLYVFQVQQASVELYNCKTMTSAHEDIDECYGILIQLIINALQEEFCDALSNNYLIDYELNDRNAVNNSFIRFLLTDNGDEISGTSQLKFILTIELINEVEHCQTVEALGDIFQIENIVPVATLRAVYDDESTENKLIIDITDVIFELDKTQMEYNRKLVKVIKNVTVNTIRKQRCKVITPILTRFYNEWCPSDPYYLSSLTKPPPYTLP